MTPEQFNERLQRAPRPVVVDVWAPWCAPCRALQPMLEQTRQEFAGRVDVLELNADEAPDVARALNVFALPTLLVFANGQEITRRVGAQSPETLRALFDSAVSGTAARRTLASGERALRLGAGAMLAGLALFSGPSWPLGVVGALVLFSAVYDRCPLWKAVTARFLRRAAS